MSYTLWHAGILVGETEFEGQQRHSKHLCGILKPTAYGREVFPRLTGIMTAMLGLKQELRNHGIADNCEDPDVIAQLIDTTSSGQRVIDIGRHLSEVTLRNAGGQVLEFTQIAFVDTTELDRLTRMIGAGRFNWQTRLALRAKPRLVVSVTLRS